MMAGALFGGVANDAAASPLVHVARGKENTRKISPLKTLNKQKCLADGPTILLRISW